MILFLLCFWSVSLSFSLLKVQLVPFFNFLLSCYFFLFCIFRSLLNIINPFNPFFQRNVVVFLGVSGRTCFRCCVCFLPVSPFTSFSISPFLSSRFPVNVNFLTVSDGGKRRQLFVLGFPRAWSLFKPRAARAPVPPEAPGVLRGDGGR